MNSMYHYVEALWQKDNDNLEIVDEFPISGIDNLILNQIKADSESYSVLFLNPVQSVCLSSGGQHGNGDSFVAYVYIQKIRDIKMRPALVSGWCLQDITRALTERFYICGGNAKPFKIIGVWYKGGEQSNPIIEDYVRCWCDVMNSALDRIDAMKSIGRIKPPVTEIYQQTEIGDDAVVSYADLGAFNTWMNNNVAAPVVFEGLPTNRLRTDLRSLVKTIDDHNSKKLWTCLRNTDGNAYYNMIEHALGGGYRCLTLTSEMDNGGVANAQVYITPDGHFFDEWLSDQPKCGANIYVWGRWTIEQRVNIILSEKLI